MADCRELTFLKIVTLLGITILFSIVETKISLSFSRTIVLVIEKVEYKIASIATIVSFKILRIYLN